MENSNQQKQVNEYLERHTMKPSALADRSGVNRWSVCKWLKDPEATIWMRTWEKIANYMTMNP